MPAEDLRSAGCWFPQGAEEQRKGMQSGRPVKARRTRSARPSDVCEAGSLFPKEPPLFVESAAVYRPDG